ncbi:hypothetical protein ACOMHN_033290 [Nucella lapillus]
MTGLSSTVYIILFTIFLETVLRLQAAREPPETNMLRFYAAVTIKVAVLVLVGAVVGVRGAYNEPDWGFQSYLNEPFTLTCNHSSLMAVSGNYIEWELPHGEMLTRGTNKHVLSSQSGLVVANMHLTVNDIQTSDTGVYVCHIYENYLKLTKRGQLLRGLNLGGHKYSEPFDEYRDHLMVGGIAAVVLFVPLIAVCFIYKFRYQTNEQKTAKHVARLEATRHQRHLAANGKGAELSDVAVKGESNLAYDNDPYMAGTRL